MLKSLLVRATVVVSFGVAAATVTHVAVRAYKRPPERELWQVVGRSFYETGLQIVVCPDPYNCQGQGNCGSRSCLRCPVVLNMQVASGGFYAIRQSTQQCPPGTQRGTCVSGASGCTCTGPTLRNVPCGPYNNVVLVEDQPG